MSTSKLSLQVLPLVPLSLNSESHSTERYGESDSIEPHRVPEGADVNNSASLDEEIAPDGKTRAFRAETNAHVSLD